MKIMKMIKLIGLIMVLAGTAFGQETLTVPLTSPDKIGSLYVNVHTGTIKVTGYSGKEVVIIVNSEQKEVSSQTKNGLRKIPNNSLGLTAREENNYVKVSTSNNNKSIDLEIKVPTNFNLKLSGHNDGGVTVENVSGDMEVSHHNGDITLTNIAGSAVVDSHNGEIKVSFTSLTPNTPMAFTTFNGDVDVTFPANLKATAKMRSDRGDLLTDFDMDVAKNQPKSTSDREDGVYKVKMDEWVIGAIGGGGPEMLFKTYNGDVIIRKK